MPNLDKSPIMQLAGEGKADELLETLRLKCFEPEGGLYYFTKVVLGYKDLVPDFHLEFCNHVQASIPLLKRGYLLARGHFKSTVLSKAYLLWRLCGGGRTDFTRDPRNLRMLVVGESDTVAKKNLNDIKWHIENNQLFRMLFPEIIPPDMGKVVWRDDEIEINRPNSFDEPTIKTVGIGAKLTGFHFDLIDYDDPIGEKAAKSDAEMKAAMDWFAYAPGLANDQKTLEEIIAGTRWKHGKADLYGYIMEELKFNEESGRTTGFTWYVRSCYNDEGEASFQPRFSKEILADILNREKTYKFSCQYLNKPVAPEGTAFSEEQIRTFKIGLGPDGKRDLIVPNDGSPPVKLAHLSRISFYDPTSGGKKAESENAITALGASADGRKFAFKVWSAKCGFRVAIEQWFKLNDQFMTWPNYFEGVGAHKEVAEIIHERQKELICRVCKLSGKDVRHRRLSPTLITPPGGDQDKVSRILTFMQADMEDGLVYIHEQDYLTRAQIISFPFGELMDRLDTLAYAIHYVKLPKSAGEAEAEEHEKEQVQAMRKPRTAQAYDTGGYC